MLRLALILAVCLFGAFGSAASAADRRVAMVVGNGNYAEGAALPNTLNDAKAVAASLERLGFRVFTAYDAAQAALLQTLGEFSAALEGADAAVFYYAGHGMQIGTENYILPVDIKAESELAIRYGALALTDVLQKVESLARVAIVILDACRDNPFAAQLAGEPGRSLGVGRGLARIGPMGNGTIIAYAAAPGEVASDGAGDHSPYTEALLAEMEKPGVEVGLLFRRVAGEVIESTSGTQRPELLVRLASEYYLADVAPVAADAVPAAITTPEPVPVDVAAATPTPLVVAEPMRGPEAADRAALWGYTSTLVDGPLFVAPQAWPVPARVTVAEVEPNSSFGTAQVINAGDEVTLSIGETGDSDFLRFAVGQAGKLTVQTKQPPAAIDLTVRLLNANGDEAVYWVVAPRPGGELFAEFEIGRPGTYWLQFADGSSDASAPEAFPVSLDFAVSADLAEPNDRIDQARQLPMDGMLTLSLFPRADTDYFKFTAPAPGALLVSLSGAPENIDTAFRLLNAEAQEIFYWVVAPRPGGDNIAVLDLPRPGVYYLQVNDSLNDASSVGPVTLMTRFAISPDLYEPNDVMAQAMPVEETSQHQLAIFPKGDNDWLELFIAQPGQIEVDIASPPDNLDLGYRVIDGSGNEAAYWTVAPRPGGDVAGSFDVARPGRYFIQIADGSNDNASVEPFGLNLTFTASLDAYEPNDGIGSARVLTPGGEVPFTILPMGDADFFRVTVEQPGELAVSIDEGPENLDLTYRVVNADWTELAYWVAAYRKGGLTEGSVDLPRPGTYYLEVRDGSNDGRSIEPATLKTVFTATPGSNEPNNSFGEATLVEITGETPAHILPMGDADWQVFYAPGPGNLDVAITEVPEKLDVAFRVLNAERAEIQYWVSAPRPGGDTTATIAIPSAGWYWLEIRDGNNDARSPLPFKISRAFRD